MKQQSSLFSLSRGMQLRSHLILLVLVALLPPLILAIVMFQQNIKLQREALDRGMRDTVHALSLAVDREAGSSLAVLQALAASPHLQSGDLKSFYQHALSVTTRNSWIVLSDVNKQLINTLLPLGASLPRGNLLDVVHGHRDPKAGLFTSVRRYRCEGMGDRDHRARPQWRSQIRAYHAVEAPNASKIFWSSSVCRQIGWPVSPTEAA